MSAPSKSASGTAVKAVLLILAAVCFYLLGKPNPPAPAAPSPGTVPAK